MPTQARQEFWSSLSVSALQAGCCVLPDHVSGCLCSMNIFPVIIIIKARHECAYTRMQKREAICHLCHHRVFFLFSQPLQNCEPVAISSNMVARIPVPAPTILLTRRCNRGIY